MIRVTYEKYYNDYRKSYETRSFYSLKEVSDWLFDMVKGNYKRSIYFTDPDSRHELAGKLKLDGSCISSYDGGWTYFIEKIEDGDKIIYSTGKFTNGICHWNDEIKLWLKECRNRRNNPTFNFG